MCIVEIIQLNLLILMGVVVSIYQGPSPIDVLWGAFINWAGNKLQSWNEEHPNSPIKISLNTAYFNDPNTKIGSIYVAGEFNWGREDTLAGHFERHGKNFGAKTESEYAKMANDFFNNRFKYEIKTDNDGTIRVYDPKTNTFGAYNPDGTTKTFFKPTSPNYWDNQLGQSSNIPADAQSHMGYNK